MMLVPTNLGQMAMLVTTNIIKLVTTNQVKLVTTNHHPKAMLVSTHLRKVSGHSLSKNIK